jgi:hypothetical protein
MLNLVRAYPLLSMGTTFGIAVVLYLRWIGPAGPGELQMHSASAEVEATR